MYVVYPFLYFVGAVLSIVSVSAFGVFVFHVTQHLLDMIFAQ